MLTQQDGGRTGDRMGKRAGLRQSDGDILLGREGTAGGKWHKGEGKDSRARIEKILDRVLEQAGKVNDRTREVGNRQEKLTAGE